MSHVLLLLSLAGASVLSGVAGAEPAHPVPDHRLVGLRPLPRFAADLKSNHGGSWAGLPTFDQQHGNYPYVAEHLDVVMGWLDGDFKTRRGFFEYYWGIDA